MKFDKTHRNIQTNYYRSKMDNLCNDFQKSLQNNEIKMQDQRVNDFLANLNLIFITKSNFQSQKIYDTVKDPKIIIIDEHQYEKQNYFIISNDKTIIIISKSELYLISPFFIKNKDSEFITLSNEVHKSFIESIIETKNDLNHIFLVKNDMQNEIKTFSENFEIKNPKFSTLWNFIRNSFQVF